MVVARGRTDRNLDTLEAGGNCIAGTALAGQPLRAGLQLSRPVATSVATGHLQVGDRPSVELVLTKSGADPGAGRDRALSTAEVAARVLLAVAVLIAVTRLIGRAFTLIHQPRVLGEIVAGVMLGPSLLGAVLPEVTRYLFAAQVTDVLKVVAQLGLILFTFLIGLGVDLGQVRRLGHAAVLISHASIVIPVSLGLLIALVLYPTLGSGSFIGFALFMGAAMAITAFPVLARILAETGIAGSTLGALAIACAAIDDVTAWCVLAVVVAVVKSGGIAHVAQVIGLSVVLAAVLILLVRPALHRLVDQDHSRGGTRPRADGGAPVMVAVVALALLAAWASNLIGTHAIFGAFTLGLVVPRSPGLISQLSSRLEPVTAVVLLPIFFATVGLSTRLGLLRYAVEWWLLALIVLAAVAGKWGGSSVAARWAGLGWADANALGILMNTRGLTEIVILSVGRSLGVVSPALFTMMVLMALVTTFMTTPLLAVIYPSRLRH